MPNDTPKRAAPKPGKKGVSKPVLWAGVAVAVFVGIPAVLYSQRGPIGTKLAVDYLKARGVPAVIRIDRLGPGGFEGAMTLGPADDPDLVIDRLVVDFDAFPLLRGGTLAPRIKMVRLVRPRLKATYARGKVSFGTMQKMIDEVLAQPAVGPPPSVAIENGVARVFTPAGLVTIQGGGSMPQGRIALLDASMGAHRLSAEGRTLVLQSANLHLRGAGDRLVGRLEASAPSFVQPDASVDDATIRASLDIPQGEASPVGFTGRFGIEGALAARRITADAQTISAPQGTLVLGGNMRGPLERLALKGRGSLKGQAAALSGPAMGQAVSIAATATDFTLSRNGGASRFNLKLDLTGGAQALGNSATGLRGVTLAGGAGEVRGDFDGKALSIQAQPRLTVTADQMTGANGEARGLQAVVASEDLSLTGGETWQVAGPLATRVTAANAGAGGVILAGLVLEGKGEADIGSQTSRIVWRGSLQGRSGATPAQAREAARSLALVTGDETAAARFLQTLSLDASDLRLESDRGVTRFDLGAPLRLAGEGGAVVAIPRGALAILDASGARGGMTVTVTGKALPEVSLDLANYRLDQQGFSGEAALDVSELNAAALKDIRLSTRGRIASADGALGFYPATCAAIAADRMEGVESPLATGIGVKLCALVAKPLVAMNAKGWEAHARFTDAAARLPAAEAALGGGAGSIDLTGGSKGLGSGALKLDTALVSDRAVEPRFHTVSLKGDAKLVGAGWTGGFAIAEARQGRGLGRIDLTHDMTSGRGEAVIDAAGLAFAKEGLQPAHISPIAGPLMSEAEGPANFTGKVAWAENALTSSGRLITTGLTFKSSVGLVKGLKGQIVFTSLAPLTTPPDQTFTIDRIDAVTPMEKASIALELTPLAMRLTRAEVSLAKGRAVLDPLELKLGAVLPTSGTLRLTDIDVETLLSPFNIADKIVLKARIDGVVPFSFTAEGLRIIDGQIVADGPGRLSIKREALTGGGEATTDGAVAAQPNAVQSFAYQAMENLAFEQMDAKIGSQPGGRLGVTFHIKGQNDPPNKAEARVPIADLLQGTAFNRDIPLPSGTPVNLTLDTSLNFDELMAAYADAWRSTAVQR